MGPRQSADHELSADLPTAEGPGSLPLTAMQQALFGALGNMDPRLSDFYLGAILVLRDASNPVRMPQAAHVLREILDAVLEAQSVEGGVPSGDMGTRLGPAEAAWNRVRDSRANEGREDWWMDDHLRSFLDAMRDFFTWKTHERKARREQMREAVRGLDVSRRVLPPVLEEEVVRDGMRLRQYFIKVCHFDVAAEENVFLERLSEFESFLLNRLSPRTFADQSALDALSEEGQTSVMQPAMERAAALMKKGAANYQYFFEHVDSPAWIRPLAQRIEGGGFFANPPAPVEDDEGIRVPGWLPSQYLVRVAARAPDEVVGLILSINTDNERIHYDFVEAAIEMPGLLASGIAKREIEWLRQRPRLYFGLPGKLAALVCHLVEEGETDVGFALAEELLSVTKQPTHTGLIPQWHGRDSDWSYREVLGKVTPALITVDAARTLKLLLDLIRIVTKGESQQAGWAIDYFRAQRPRLEADDRSDYAVDQALLTALRDAARRVRSEGLLGTAELLDLLGPEDSRLYHRLACYTISSPPPPEVAALRRLLLTREAFLEGEPSPEYRALLSDSFSRLSEEERLHVLGWIDSGPPKSSTTESLGGDRAPSRGGPDPRRMQGAVVHESRVVSRGYVAGIRGPHDEAGARRRPSGRPPRRRRSPTPLPSRGRCTRGAGGGA